jgi:hypothetical protein
MNDSDKNTTLYYNGNEDKNLYKIMTYPSTFIECISTYDKCNGEAGIFFFLFRVENHDFTPKKSYFFQF